MSASVADRFQTALNLLAEWGFKTSTVAGWQTRKARKDITYDPAGVVNHHTGAWETKDDMLFRTGRTGHFIFPFFCSDERQRVVVRRLAGARRYAPNKSKPFDRLTITTSFGVSGPPKSQVRGQRFDPETKLAS